MANHSFEYFLQRDINAQTLFDSQVAIHLLYANRTKHNVTTCRQRFAQYSCATQFLACEFHHEIKPCMGYCYNFYVDCGYNKTMIRMMCGTPYKPTYPWRPGLCTTPAQILSTSTIWLAYLSPVILGSIAFVIVTIFGNLKFLHYCCCLLCLGRNKDREGIVYAEDFRQIQVEENLAKQEEEMSTLVENLENNKWKQRGKFVAIFCSKTFLYSLDLFIFVLFIFILPIPLWKIESANELQSFHDPKNLKWTYSSTVYVCFATMTTIGFGDIIPVTPGGKAYMAVYSMFSFIVFLSVILLWIAPLFHFTEKIIQLTNKIFNKLIQKVFRHEEADIVHFRVTSLMKVLTTLMFLGLLIILFSIIMASVEDWDYEIAIWFSYTTLSGMGFGDHVPVTDAGRWLFIIFTLFGLSLLTLLIAFIGNRYLIGSRTAIDTAIEYIICCKCGKRSSVVGTDPRSEGTKLGRKVLFSRFKDWLRIRIIRSLSLLPLIFISLIIFGVLPIPVCQMQRTNEETQFKEVRRWDWLSCYYFSFTALSRIGYGDYFPETIDSRAYWVFYSFIGIVFLTYMLIVTAKPLFNLLDRVIKVFFGCLVFWTKEKKTRSKAETCSKILRGPISKSIYVFAIIILHIFICAAIMGSLESWSYGNSLWWAYTTITTIGYGDFYPLTRGGKVFCVYFAFVGVGLLGLYIGYLAEQFVIKPKMKLEKRLEITKDTPQNNLNESLLGEETEKSND